MSTTVGRHEIIHYIVDGIEYPFVADEQQVVGQQLVVDPHYHSFIEILFCVKGEYHIFLDGVNYHFKQGDMVIINSDVVHHTRSLFDGLNSYYVIRFNPEILYTTIHTVFESRYILPFTMKNSAHQQFFTNAEIESTQLPQLVKQIVNESRDRSYGFELAIRTYISEIFLWVLRTWHKKGLNLNLNNSLNNTMEERLINVFEFVDNCYSEPISVEDAARLCDMSYSYFSRFFKQTTGRNFSDYVNRVRIIKSEHLLATTSTSITTIAMEVGFSTTSYYIAQFKKFKGITPKQYRIRFNRNDW